MDPFAHFSAQKTAFWPKKGPFGFQKAHIGIQEGPIHCWVISTNILTPIWLSVITKGTRAHLFRPKNHFLIKFWPFKGPGGQQQC